MILRGDSILGKTGKLIYELPVILASGSPRRIAMLREIGKDPIIISPGCSEEIHSCLAPHRIVMALALRKLLRVRENTAPEELPEDHIMLSSDTVVSFGGEILGKPSDEADAFAMLKKLSGNMNTVFSGCCVWHKKSGSFRLFYDSTDVYFKPYSDDDIRSYIASGASMDKAGGYGIQEGFDKYVSRIDGEEDTVIGFPLAKLLAM